VHLCLKKQRSPNEGSASAHNHMKCWEEFTVRSGPPEECVRRHWNASGQQLIFGLVYTV